MLDEVKEDEHFDLITNQVLLDMSVTFIQLTQQIFRRQSRGLKASNKFKIHERHVGALSCQVVVEVIPKLYNVNPALVLSSIEKL